MTEHGPPNFHRLAAGYFLLQGLGGGLWWWSMVNFPTVAGWFEFWVEGLVMAHFMLADIGLFVCGSFFAAALLWRRSPVAQSACWCLVGATLYATLMCLQGAITGSMPTLCFVMMIPACMLSVHASVVGCGEGTFPFRIQAPKNPLKIFLFALGQTVAFYTIFFALIPFVVMRAQQELGIPLFVERWPLKSIAVVGFLAGGTLAISSTVQFAWRGQGTPLPTQAPAALVVQGPYRYVRNPMAVGGIFQGIMVGLFVGSWPVMLYSLMGAIIWHVFVKPVEEFDLANRFGESYRLYCAKVKCWWPRIG